MRVERRAKPRTYQPFPLVVRGTDAAGENFEINGSLDNLSACGMYARVDRKIDAGARLLLIIRLAGNSAPDLRSIRIAARGTVLRAEPQPDGKTGIAVSFSHHRFL